MNKLEVTLEILKLVESSSSLQKLAAEEKLDKLLLFFEKTYHQISVITKDEQLDSFAISDGEIQFKDDTLHIGARDLPQTDSDDEGKGGGTSGSKDPKKDDDPKGDGG